MTMSDEPEIVRDVWKERMEGPGNDARTAAARVVIDSLQPFLTGGWPPEEVVLIIGGPEFADEEGEPRREQVVVGIGRTEDGEDPRPLDHEDIVMSVLAAAMGVMKGLGMEEVVTGEEEP